MPSCGACGLVFKKPKDCIEHIRKCRAAEPMRQVLDITIDVGATTTAGNSLDADEIVKVLGDK